MNSYLLITRSGLTYAVLSLGIDWAIQKVEAHSGDTVSCWFIGDKIPNDAIHIQ